MIGNTGVRKIPITGTRKIAETSFRKIAYNSVRNIGGGNPTKSNPLLAIFLY